MRKMKMMPKMQRLKGWTALGDNTLNSADTYNGVPIVGRIIAGEKIPPKGFKSAIKRFIHYRKGVVGLNGTLGSHGTLDYFVRKARIENLNYRALLGAVDKFESKKEIRLKIKGIEKRKGLLMEITREIPKQHRGMGIGTEFLREAEKIARENEISLIYAATKNPASVKTYQKAGWEIIWENREQDKYCYGKFLD